MAAAPTYACAIRAVTLRAACWGGAGAAGEQSPPDVAFAYISLGFTHACGVTSTGLPRCWGSSEAGQGVLPTTEERYGFVAAGDGFTCW